jgi:hypothetical protein
MLKGNETIKEVIFNQSPKLSKKGLYVRVLADISHHQFAIHSCKIVETVKY